MTSADFGPAALTPPILRIEGLRKSFAGVHALRDASLDVRPGEIHTLLGENGAGKSTLVKVLAGVHRPDGGTIAWDGQVVERLDVATSWRLGIRIIHQHLNTLPHLTVLENLGLGREPTRRGILQPRRERAQARAALDRMGVRLDLDREAGSLPVAERQLIEIARALTGDERLLIMDEPTASLGEREVERLFAVMRGVRDAGVAVIFISHKLTEVLDVSDRVTVLRDGRTIATVTPAATSPEGLVELMVGRELAQGFHVERSPAGDEVLLEATDLWTDEGLRGVSLELRRGEILGVYGLMGSGRTELHRALFGADRLVRGSMRVGGQPYRPGSPRDALRRGLGLVPEERRQAVFEGLSVRDNAAIASGDRIARWGILAPGRERSLATRIVRSLGVRTASIDTTIGWLSGGNQQKVVLGRWLSREPGILLLDDPTSGVDVGAKLEIYRIVADLTRAGMGVLMSSSELPELLAIADRIVVLHGGRVAGTVEAEGMDQRTVLDLAVRGTTARGDTADEHTFTRASGPH